MNQPFFDHDMVYIDTIDVCQLKCPTCLRGSRVMENTNEKLPLDRFRKIVEKVAAQRTRRIGLYNWSEPFLNARLHSYISIVKSHGILCDISTTLSLRKIDNLEDCLIAGLDSMTVSISGITQDIYSINHVDGVIEYVLANLELLSKSIAAHDAKTIVTLRFLQFNYNIHQTEGAKAIADRLGFQFEILPGAGNPQGGSMAFMTDAFFKLEARQKAVSISPEDSGQVCPLMIGQMVINSTGDQYLCCAVPNTPSFKIGDYLELSESESLAKRFGHAYCRACTMSRRPQSPRDQERLSLAGLR